MSTYKEAHHRSIVKAVSWRCIASLTTFSIVLVLTRFLDMEVSEGLKYSAYVGMADVVIKLLFYYLHERIWGVIGFGKKNHPLSSLPVNKPIEDEDMEIIKNKLKDLGYLDEED